MTKVLYYKSKQRCITKPKYCITKVNKDVMTMYCITKVNKVLYYKSKQMYDQSIVLQK